ncbi:SDR family NAD(P)-dependent oxidoreductase [Actinokineospora sp. G85]|uniref:SDR family NAD(P)-dependent oxidoreductase n=1 Tax=Actinokineospora sp. G85 TaxID=3406626 RepID=UPI003C73ABD6
MVSRSADHHASYVEALGGARASTHVCDVRDRAALAATLADIGEVDVLYHGPGGGGTPPGPITEVDSAAVRDAMDNWVHPAVDAVGLVLPGMVARGSGVLLFAGGLSSVVALPPLGALALATAALRNYAVTLNAALADSGVYAGTLTIGGLVRGGDIHAMVTADPGRYGEVGTLDPAEIAATAWEMATTRDRAESVFTAM